MDKYIENYGKYTKRVRMLYVCSLLLFVFLAVFEYVCSGKILAAIGALACGVVVFVVIRLLQKADDDFISEVVAAMSDLLDNLSELKRQQVFPEDEDSLVSRLQSKVDKIIDALKLQNSRERLEHENIKGLVSDLSHQLKTPISNLIVWSKPEGDFVAVEPWGGLSTCSDEDDILEHKRGCLVAKPGETVTRGFEIEILKRAIVCLGPRVPCPGNRSSI